jgi:hypothetical protein
MFPVQPIYAHHDQQDLNFLQDYQ